MLWVGRILIVLAVIGIVVGAFRDGYNLAPLILQAVMLTTGVCIVWVVTTG